MLYFKPTWSLMRGLEHFSNEPWSWLASMIVGFDQGRPWAAFTVEDVVYNADVKTYVRSKGL